MSSRKPENRFRDRIHNKLDPSLHRDRTNNPDKSGIADDWYSGNLDDLWVEYKWITTSAPRARSVWALLSPLQQVWVQERRREGRNVAVIVGAPKRGWIFVEGDCTRWVITPQTPSFTEAEIAAWIMRRTMHASTQASPARGQDDVRRVQNRALRKPHLGAAARKGAT